MIFLFCLFPFLFVVLRGMRLRVPLCHRIGYGRSRGSRMRAIPASRRAETLYDLDGRSTAGHLAECERFDDLHLRNVTDHSSCWPRSVTEATLHQFSK